MWWGGGGIFDGEVSIGERLVAAKAPWKEHERKKPGTGQPLTRLYFVRLLVPFLESLGISTEFALYAFKIYLRITHLRVFSLQFSGFRGTTTKIVPVIRDHNSTKCTSVNGSRGQMQQSAQQVKMQLPSYLNARVFNMRNSTKISLVFKSHSLQSCNELFGTMR